MHWILEFRTWVLTVMSLGAGAFLGAYLRKKGQNLATHEDISKLVDQVKATTEATKAIEARISDQFWNRQRHWEMKRDSLLEALASLGRLDDALVSFAVVIDAEKKGTTDPEVLRGAIREAHSTWYEASRDYSKKRVMALVICGRKTNAALLYAGKQLIEGHRMLKAGEVASYNDLPVSLQQAIARVFSAVRKELGIEEVGESSDSFPK
jgi:hypothetical protein